MKLVLGLVAVLLMGSAVPALAQRGPETSLGFHLGTARIQSDDVFDNETKIQNPTVLGVTAGMRQGTLGGEISVDWISVDLRDKIKYAEVTLIPILLTAEIHSVAADSAFDPYILIGVGYYLNSARASSEAKSLAASSGDSNFKVGLDNAVGIHLGLGTNIKVSSSIAFAINWRYTFMDTDLTIKGSGSSVSDTLSVNGFVLTAGLKYLLPR